MTLIPILIVLYFTTVFFAGELIWVYSIAELFVLFFSLIFLLIFVIRSGSERNTPRVIYKDPVTLFGLLFLALVAFQLIPLPPTLLKILSPMSFEIWAKSPLPSGSYFPISVHPYATKHGLIFAFCLLLVFFWVLYGIKTRQQMENLVLGILIFGALLALNGLVETVTGTNSIFWWNKPSARDALTGPFPNRNQFATFLSMILSLGVGYFWALTGAPKKAEGKYVSSFCRRLDEWVRNLEPKRILTFLSLLILLFTLLSTTSRGGNLATLGSLILMTGLIVSQNSRLKRGWGFLILLALVVSLGTYLAGERLWTRLAQSGLDAQVRLEMSKDTLSVHQDFPFLGSGYNTFSDIFTRYAKESPKILDHAHNDWVELLAVTGWVGFFIILTGAVFLFSTGLRRLKGKGGRFSQSLLVGGLGALFSVSLHALTDFSLHNTANALFFAAIIGMLAKSIYSFPDSGQDPKGGAIEVKVQGSSHFLNIILLIIFLFLIVWSANSATRLFLMNRIISIEKDVKTDWPDSGLEPPIKAVRLNPDDRLGWFWLAQTLSKREAPVPYSDMQQVEIYRLSDWREKNNTLTNQTLFSIQEALARRPSSWFFWRFMASQAAGKITENQNLLEPLAIHAFERTVFFNPNDPRAYFERGRFWLSRSVGSKEPALEKWGREFKKSLELNPYLTSDVVFELSKEGHHNFIEEAQTIFPNKAEVWIKAGETLLDKGRYEEGEFLLRKGEALKVSEAELLVEKIKWGIRERKVQQTEKVLNELQDLDPDHPYPWYARGEILKSMQLAQIRGVPLKAIDTPDRLRAGLANLKIQKNQEGALVRFFSALLDMEEKKYAQAARTLDRVLDETPNSFPALLAREKIGFQSGRYEGEELQLAAVQKKLDLFSMEEIPQDAWRPRKQGEGEPKIFEAVFRNRKPIEELKINLPVEKGGWAVYVDERFERGGVFAGNSFKLTFSSPLKTGEHIIRIKPL